jgi:MFS family permease
MGTSKTFKTSKRAVHLTVLISALGYFVDIYDLLLFGIVRAPSLRDLGVPEDKMLEVGIHLLNMQMGGMLIGGIIWGVLGDLRGRKSVLFGSILLYSLANIANAFVPNPEVYAWLRFVAGIGLAGELGAAICLVSEVMSKESRGYGTTIVASVGILGAVMASLIGDYFSWQTAYIVGGAMGLALLALRASMLESGMYKSMDSRKVSRGKFHQLFTEPKRLGLYLCCILIGVPIWYVIGVLITFAPELSKELNVQGIITGSKAIMWSYIGLSLGDLSAGLISQYLRSRRKAVLLFLILMSALIAAYVQQNEWSTTAFYTLCVGLGFSAGYWAVFVTIGAEQFGTNIRATVATTVPNFVRGSVVPITLSFRYFQGQMGTLNAVCVVGLAVMSIALVALFFLRETFGKDLDYLEPL